MHKLKILYAYENDKLKENRKRSYAQWFQKLKLYIVISETFSKFGSDNEVTNGASNKFSETDGCTR